jgi:transposase
MRITSAFSRLLDLPGVWVRSVVFEPGCVVVTVALRRRVLVCPEYSYATPNRENEQDHDSSWRHLDLGRWRLVVRCRLRRLVCPEHGAHVEGVPFARPGARFTRDFDDLIAWLATKTDKTATCRLTRIDWHTVGRVITRVAGEQLDGDRLEGLFEVSIDEVAWRKGHRYLTLVGDHRTGRVVWGCEGRVKQPQMSSSTRSTRRWAATRFQATIAFATRCRQAARTLWRSRVARRSLPSLPKKRKSCRACIDSCL